VSKHIAVYVRVSSKAQDHRSQEPELKRHAAAQDEPVVWYWDKHSGSTMDRPGWNKLERALRSGKVSAIVVWRLDRLGRTAKGLTALFDDLQTRKVNLVSLRDGVDLTTPAGRLMANVLASVAAYETEVRAERIQAGQAAARAKGKRWGGSKAGKRTVVTPEKERAIRQLHADGTAIVRIAKAVGLSRPTIYDVLAEGVKR
jgi:DNA invertase Pin-like site-specific DNA recombinase